MSAKRYSAMFRARIRDPRDFVDRVLSAHLADTIVSFSRSAAEASARADANKCQITEDIFIEDIKKLNELGSFQALVDCHNDKQKETGLSLERVDQYLAS